MRYLICLLLVGCMSARKAEKQLDKIQDKFPSLATENCIDNLILKRDTLVEYDFIEIEQDTIHQTDTKMDTFIKKVFIKTPVKKQTITVYVENTDRIEELSNQLDKSILLRKEEAKKANVYKGYTKILGIFLALLIIALYLVKQNDRTEPNHK